MTCGSTSWPNNLRISDAVTLLSMQDIAPETFVDAKQSIKLRVGRLVE